MNKRKKKKFKLFHIIIMILLIYIMSSFLKQEIKINKLKSAKSEKEKEVLILDKEIYEIKELVNELQVADLERYISLLDKLNEYNTFNNKDTEEYKKIIEEIKLLEQNLRTSDLTKYIEKIAREDYKLINPNEIIFIDRSNSKENKND